MTRACRTALLSLLTFASCHHESRTPPVQHADRAAPLASTSHPGVAASSAPSAAPTPLRIDAVNQLVALDDAFCARVETGQIYCWGTGVNGEIGDGALQNRNHPTLVIGIAHASAIAAHGERACAIENGRVLCWGASLESSAGRMLPRPTPAAIGEEHDVVEIALGFAHVWMRHANGDVTYRIVYPGTNAEVRHIDLPAPATALAADDDTVCASTTAGVYCQSFATMASGGVALASPHRVMDASPMIALAARLLCGLHNDHIECVGAGSSPQHASVDAASPRSFAFVTPPLFPSIPPPLCVVGTGDPFCANTSYGQRQSFSPGAEVVALVGNQHHCALLRSGEVRCESDGTNFARVAVGAAAPARADGTLASELSENSFVEAARIGANGAVEYCVARRAEIGDALSNRQCLSLSPDATSVVDMPEWHEERPTVGWSSSTITVTRSDGPHELHFDHPSDVDDGDLNAVVDARGDQVAAIFPGPHDTRTVAVMNVETGTTAYTRSPPGALTQNFALLGGALVSTYAHDMVDGGTFSVELWTPSGVHQRIGRCPATPDIPCAWELSPVRSAILTYRGVLIFSGARAAREVTGFNPPGEAVRWLLEDATRNRLYAIHDQPLGAVDVFDRGVRRVLRTVAPRGP